ncbi:MAG: hypothetical protein K0U72_01700 [Gammaproteobacteria bacterium]|nr:hypothetical protein [Gammaproteobacteria bacterium]
MLRIPLFLGLLGAAGVAVAADDDKLEHFQSYFKKLDLPYVEARGCSDAAPCAISADFNDDGVDDYAALYEYVGPTSRRNHWNIDLVIVYSQADSSNMTHAVYTHVGQLDQKSQTVAGLALQRPGLMKIPMGDLVLERPAINIVSTRSKDPNQFATFYWRGAGFHSIDKSDD